MSKKVVGALVGLGVLFLLLQWWDGQRSDEYEGRVKDALGKQKKEYEAGTEARTDSLRKEWEKDQRLKAADSTERAVTIRTIRRTDTLRVELAADTTAQDSIVTLLKTVGSQAETIASQGRNLAIKDQRIGVLEGAGHLWQVQRASDSTRIAELTGLLEDRPSAKWLGFIPKPKCGPGGGVATNGQAFTPGVVFACILPL